MLLVVVDVALHLILMNKLFMWSKTFSSLLFCLFLVSSAYSQNQTGTATTTTVPSQGAQQLINQAKAAGATDAMIQQAKQNGLTPEQRAQAKMAGYSDAQIDAGLSKLKETSTQATTVQDIDRNLTDPEETEVERTDSDKKQVSRSLSIFGREIFSSKNLTFAPNFNIPTPKSYRLAAGDQIIISVWGSSEANYEQKISPEGRVTIPLVGPISLVGLSMQEAEARLRERFKKVYAGLNGGGTHLTISLGKIRSIKINMVGEVAVPGTYTLPSLATLFNALYIAGGVNKTGSLRSIKVYRNSKLIGNLDVYDYLLNGKFESNIRLEDNDMIIVEPYQKLVTIEGKVKRPRIFEMKKDETLHDLIRFAGGFMGDAYSNSLQVKRKTGRMYEMFNVDENEFAQFKMQDGDNLNVGEILNTFKNRLTVVGAVFRPGEYALTEKVNSIKSLLEKSEGVTGDAFLDRAQITRLLPDLSFEVIPVDLKGILNGSKSDIPLQAEDVFYIPSIYDITEAFSLSVKGEVLNPGTYPYKKNVSVEDLVIMAGGFKYNASLINVEVARRIRNPRSETGTSEIAKIFRFSLNDNFAVSDTLKHFILEPFDEVFIRKSPGYETQQAVTIGGEVNFAGEYILSRKGQRLSDLVKQAGGVTPEAYVKGSRLIRKIDASESAKLKTLLKLASQNRKDSIEMSKLDVGNEYFVGINLQKALKKPASDDDIVLREGDRIFVPQFNNTVRISGSVLYPNTVTFNADMNFKDYVEQAGGFDSRAKKRKSFVIYMNGTVARCKTFHKPRIEPGCEIVVPTKPDRKGVSAAEILGFTSSTASIAAMVATLINAIK